MDLGTYTDLPSVLNFNTDSNNLTLDNLYKVFGKLPNFPTDIKVNRGGSHIHEGVEITELSWSTGYGPLTQSYLLNNFYFYLFILYSLEIFLLIYFFYINLSNKLITFNLILIVLFLSLFGRLLGSYLDNFTDWQLAKKMRFEKLEEAQEILKKQEDKLRKYHLLNYGQVFENIIKKEINKKKQARLNEIDRSLFETKFEDLDTETSKLIYDRVFLPGRLQNFIITYCIYILLYILTNEDFSIFKIIFLLLYSNENLYL